MDDADHHDTLWPIPPGASCVYCGEVPASGAPLALRLLQCERRCLSRFHEACYWQQAAPLRERVYRDFDAEAGEDRYSFFCRNCRS